MASRRCCHERAAFPPARARLRTTTSTPIASGGSTGNWTGWLGWGVDRAPDRGATGFPPADESPAEAKRRLRLAALAGRAARSPEERLRAGAAIADHVVELAGALVARTVAGYAAVGTEPPSLPALDRLLAAGVAVLLPVVAGTDLDWADYTGPDALRRAARGLLEPVAARVGVDALGSVDLVLAPALLVDGSGHRLGRGAGYYDRALRRAAAPVYAVVYDDELTEALPYQRHDMPVDGVLTPSGAVRFRSPGR
jgi:5-formyltetrahydrofolate cyclo-ligase